MAMVGTVRSAGVALAMMASLEAYGTKSIIYQCETVATRIHWDLGVVVLA